MCGKGVAYLILILAITNIFVLNEVADDSESASTEFDNKIC